MKKKLVAFMCAAMLAFGVPATAFAGNAVFNGEEGSDAVTAEFNTIKSGATSIADVKIVGTADMVATAEIKPVAASSAPSNAIAGTVASFDIDCYDESRQLVASVGTKYNNMSFTYQLAESALANLPSGISRDNLYLGGRIVNKAGGMATPLTGVVLPPANAESVITAGVNISGAVGTSTLTLWVQSGQYASAPDTLQVLEVSGDKDVSARGDLTVPLEDVSISAEKLTSGSLFNALRAAVGGRTMLGVFEVNMKLDGVPRHDEFGRLHLGFQVGSSYDGRTVTVWHRHNNGRITTEVTRVVGGMVNIVVTDLSSFAIGLGDATGSFDSGSSDGSSDSSTAPNPVKTDDPTVSPKTGQSVPAGTPAVALCAVVVLGAASVFLANRKMMR